MCKVTVAQVKGNIRKANAVVQAIKELTVDSLYAPIHCDLRQAISAIHRHNARLMHDVDDEHGAQQDLFPPHSALDKGPA